MSEDSGGVMVGEASTSTRSLSSTINAPPFIPPSYANNSNSVPELTTPRGTSIRSNGRRDATSSNSSTASAYASERPEIISPVGKVLSPSSVHATPFVPRSRAPHFSEAQSKGKLSPNAAAFVPRGEILEASTRTTGRTALRGGSAFHDLDGAAVFGGTDRVQRTANGSSSFSARTPRSPTGQYDSTGQYNSTGQYRQPTPRYSGRGRGYKNRQQNQNNSNPHAAYLVSPGKMHLASKFMGEQLRRDLQQGSYLNQAQLSEEEAAQNGIPALVQNYHSLCPLEDVSLAKEQASVGLGVHTCVMKGVSMVNGAAYALRRIDGRQVSPSTSLLQTGHDAVNRWYQVSNHPNLVGLRFVFQSSEMYNVSSMFFAHDYHPGSVTLHFAHIQNQTVAAEDQLWSYLVQLCAAIRAVHSSGLAFRPEGLMATRILLTSNGRLRVNCIGILDVLEGERYINDDLAMLQRSDLAALGKLMLDLACSGGDTGLSPLDHCSFHYSVDFVRLVNALLGSVEGGQMSDYRHLCSALSDRTMAVLDSANIYNDGLISEMTKEVENGRLMRLLVKLGMINERPGDGIAESDWSETGNRYLLKLFRDFVFHQTNEDGAPVIDWGHIIECLNKLDAGVPEQILLLSRDERSLLVVSYADIKRCVESCYNELKTKSEAFPGNRKGR